MRDDIKSKIQGLDPFIRPRNIREVVANTANIYESIIVINKRAEEISVELKDELHKKLQEFASTSDTIEEILENKEQIEISKFYERLPDPTIIATEEFLNGGLSFEFEEPKVQEEDDLV